MANKGFDKICTCCGIAFKAESRNKRLCPGCASVKLEQRIKKTRADYKKPGRVKGVSKVNPVKKADTQRPDVRRCKSCFYGALLDGSVTICDYISITGHRRPCPPGAECTCYKEKESGKKANRGRVKLGKMRTDGEYSAYISGRILKQERHRYNHRTKG